MLEGQTNIFEMLYPTYKITKPIRLIELFAGYGSQALALKYLGVNFKHWKICEWAVKSIQAYKDIHFEEDAKDYSKDLEIGEIKEFLFNKGISSNYNEPMSMAQINRLNNKQVRTIYNNIQVTHNLVNIQQVKGKDLEIVDTDKYDYILTYSFPCQDLSLAGKQKGMSDTSTRSGMLWEVERILTECEGKPQILIMENVPMVHSSDNVEDFNKWQLRLEELGYKNCWQDLIATDYGIPQTRNRTFMVSILGDYNYTFPKPISLKLKLKDMLEDNADEKYYLSEKGMQYICGNALNKNLKDHIDRSKAKLNKEIAYTINTKQDRRCGDANFILDGYGETTIKDFLKLKNENNKIKELFKLNPKRHSSLMNSILDYDGSCPTLDTMNGGNREPKILIKNATAKGYLEATDGDGIDLTQPNSEIRRGRVQKETIQTLTTQNNLGVVNNLRIRKLTPRECFRLMGVKDEDFDKAAKNQSDSSLYHLAGDSICTSCLMALFSQFLNITWENKL